MNCFRCGEEPEGGRGVVTKLIRKLGGKVESFYYSFGTSDVIAIMDMPNVATAAAISIGIKSTGAVNISLTPFIEPKEIDTAARMSIGYRAPGN